MLEKVSLLVNGEELELGSLVMNNEAFKHLKDVTEDPKESHKFYLTSDENVSVVTYGNAVQSFIFGENYDDPQILVNGKPYTCGENTVMEHASSANMKFRVNSKDGHVIRVQGTECVDMNGDILTDAQVKKLKITGKDWYDVDKYFAGKYAIYRSNYGKNVSKNEIQVCLKMSGGQQVLV